MCVLCVCMYVCVLCVCMYVCMYVCVFCVYVCMCVCFVCMYVCVCMCCVCMYVCVFYIYDFINNMLHYNVILHVMFHTHYVQCIENEFCLTVNYLHIID
jgi:hypothetical protein